MSIQYIFKNYSKILQNHWNKVLPFNIFNKEFIKYIQKNQELQIILASNSTDSIHLSKIKDKILLENKINFSIPSLLYLLIFDDNTKIKSSICKTIITILDGVQADKLLITMDGEKLEKIKLDPYKSLSHQLYQIIKNLNLTILFALYLESNQSVFNQLLRV